MNAFAPRTLPPLAVPAIPPPPEEPGFSWLTDWGWRDFLELGPVPTAPRTVRGVIRERLPLWGLGHLVDVAELVASELVANSVAATGNARWEGRIPPVRVWLLGSASSVAVPVWDGVPRPPVKRDADVGDESGRGLQIVEALSQRWGCYFPSHPFTGKVTWAAIRSTSFTEG